MPPIPYGLIAFALLYGLFVYARVRLFALVDKWLSRRIDIRVEQQRLERERQRRAAYKASAPARAAKAKAERRARLMAQHKHRA